MAGEIPIQNIYHLLCYAWDYLPEAGEVDVVAEDAHSLDELFARVLVNGTKHILRRGLDRDYQLQREETGRLRGRFNLTASFSRQTMRQGRMICEFDDLSHNVLHNRILKSTLEILADNWAIKGDTASDLHQLTKIFREIQPIGITSRLFRQIRLHRNNRHYRLLLNICELIHESLLPAQESGHSRFRDFTRDENAMPRLFEAFVRNFYRRHSRFEVSAAHLNWNVEGDQKTLDLVPRMETDVSLYSPERQIILDCKFYRKALTDNRGSLKFNRDHIFQLFAYLENAPHSKNWFNAEGCLLYPATNLSASHNFQLNGHRVAIRSLDLDQKWSAIEHQLLDITKPREPTKPPNQVSNAALDRC